MAVVAFFALRLLACIVHSGDVQCNVFTAKGELFSSAVVVVGIIPRVL